MNILADLQSAIHSINRFNVSLDTFRKQTLKIKELYDEDNPTTYLAAIDKLLTTLSHREMYLIIALIGDEQTLIEIIGKSEDHPSELILKLLNL